MLFFSHYLSLWSVSVGRHLVLKEIHHARGSQSSLSRLISLHRDIREKWILIYFKHLLMLLFICESQSSSSFCTGTLQLLHSFLETVKTVFVSGSLSCWATKAVVMYSVTGRERKTDAMLVWSKLAIKIITRITAVYSVGRDTERGGGQTHSSVRRLKFTFHRKIS